MSRLPGPSQTPIAPVIPGEPLSQTLINQIIGGANNARMVSGDKGVEVTNIGGLLGISLNPKPGNDRGVLVEIQPTDDIANGFYRGRLYTQSQVFFGAGDDGTLTTAQTPRPAPEVNSCYVVNLAQVDPAYLGSNDTTSYSYGVTQLTQRRMAVGRMIGQMTSMGLAAKYPPGPLVAVDIAAVSSSGSEVIQYIKLDETDDTIIVSSTTSTSSFVSYTSMSVVVPYSDMINGLTRVRASVAVTAGDALGVGSLIFAVGVDGAGLVAFGTLSNLNVSDAQIELDVELALYVSSGSDKINYTSLATLSRTTSSTGISVSKGNKGLAFSGGFENSRTLTLMLAGTVTSGSSWSLQLQHLSCITLT